MYVCRHEGIVSSMGCSVAAVDVGMYNVSSLGGGS